jgi:hypothetical protein
MTDQVAMRAARDRWLADPESAGTGKAFEAGWSARDDDVTALTVRAEVADGRAVRAIATLTEIVNHFGHVCDDFGYEICRHRACDDSYNAWSAAHRALNDLGLIADGQSFGNMTSPAALEAARQPQEAS